MKESLLLKWGTLKGWDLRKPESQAALRKYAALGMSMGAMSQEDTPQHKLALCELIDVVDGTIENDWTGEIMSKDEAKEYVMEYGK